MREHHPLEFRDESAAATVPAEVAAQLLRAGIHRLALGDLLEVAALLELDEQRIRARLGACLGRRRCLRRDDDLSEGHGRRPPLKSGAAPLERRRDFFFGDVDRLRSLAQLGERLLLEIAGAGTARSATCDTPRACRVRRSAARYDTRSSDLNCARTLLDLAVDGGGDRRRPRPRASALSPSGRESLRR